MPQPDDPGAPPERHLIFPSWAGKVGAYAGTAAVLLLVFQIVAWFVQENNTKDQLAATKIEMAAHFAAVDTELQNHGKALAHISGWIEGIGQKLGVPEPPVPLKRAAK